ncbi:hypothetical protein GGI02_001157 [Coemansia sp. RSA 2322]|nr:hypothetical protein GGI02_001157 [Coemansia sp. RSA 2322]
MVKELQIKINQQTLLIERNQRELYAMDKQYNSMLYSSDAPAPAPSLQADWEEVMEMAKIAPENMPARSPASSNSSSETLFKSMYGTTAAESAEAHTRSQQRTFVPQMTPPIEEVVELRERLKVLEQSPLFADPPALMGGALQPHGLATGQRSPYSLP